MRAAWIGLALLAAVTPGRRATAQFFDTDNKLTCWSCNSHNSHATVSAVFDLVIRPAPLLAKSWRGSPLGRIAIVSAFGTLYELNDYRICATFPHPPCSTVPGRGFGPIDIVYDALGAALVEVAGAGLKKIRQIHF